MQTHKGRSIFILRCNCKKFKQEYLYIFGYLRPTGFVDIKVAFGDNRAVIIVSRSQVQVRILILKAIALTWIYVHVGDGGHVERGNERGKAISFI
jgi:hypothetical protein